MASGKRIAVIVKGEEPRKQSEALRMSLGLTVLHEVDVFIPDSLLVASTGDISFTLGMMKEVGMGIYSSNPLNEAVSYLTLEEMARKFPEYDTVLTY